jgi:hypothetical protein
MPANMRPPPAICATSGASRNTRNESRTLAIGAMFITIELRAGPYLGAEQAESAIRQDPQHEASEQVDTQRTR